MLGGYVEVLGGSSDHPYLNCKRFASPADPPENFGFLGPGHRGKNLKSKKNKIGISFSLWEANGDKFVILASSSPRDLENRIPH